MPSRLTEGPKGSRTPFCKVRGWNLSQVHLFVSDVKGRIGLVGWGILGLPLRRALLAERALQVVTGQHAETVNREAVEALIEDMEHMAGLGPNA